MDVETCSTWNRRIEAEEMRRARRDILGGVFILVCAVVIALYSTGFIPGIGYRVTIVASIEGAP
jgi:hypothetical protein